MFDVQAFRSISATRPQPDTAKGRTESVNGSEGVGKWKVGEHELVVERQRQVEREIRCDPEKCGRHGGESGIVWF